MPELAEVQTVRTTLQKQILHHPIRKIDVLYSKIIENDLDYFINHLLNHEFIDIKRKGKYLIFETDDQYLISHLRMEGKYFIKNKEDEIVKHEHVIFYFDDFTLRYHDTRKFGRMKLINKDALDDYFKDLGPDANSDIDTDYLYNKLHNKKIPIKTLLLDQSIIAGLGNIYVDEVLYEAKINPFRLGCKITKEDTKNIIMASKKILDEAIKCKGTTIRSYTSSLGVYGTYQDKLNVHTKTVCKCGNPIKIERIGGRSTYYCPKCQK